MTMTMTRYDFRTLASDTEYAEFLAATEGRKLVTTDDKFTNAEPPPRQEAKRDSYGRYLLPVPIVTGKEAVPSASGRPKESAFTRVTTFAKSISDTYTLSQWSQRMVAKGLTLRPDQYALVAATPLENREALNSICDVAKEAAGAKSAASLGTALHSFTEQVDAGEDPTVPSPWDADVAAYKALVADAGIEFFPHLIERIVVCDTYGIAGTFDRIGRLTRDLTLPGLGIVLSAGDWVVVDLKTGRDLTYGWNEIAIQLAIYANATAMYNPVSNAWDEIPPVSRAAALVIHLPVEQAKATLYAVDIHEGWTAADMCSDVRSWRKNRKLAEAVSVADSTPKAEPLASAKPARRASPARKQKTETRTPTYAERIETAWTKTELSAIWKEASGKGEWTEELATLGKNQMSKFATL
jgi:hypothetical protein